MIRIFIADDHMVVRVGLAALLAYVPDFVVVGEAKSGYDLLDQVKKTRPDVLILDLRMEGFSDPVEFVEQLKEDLPQIKVLVLTGFDDEELMYSLIRAGALGYLLKDGPDDVAEAVRTVAQGRHYFPLDVKDYVMYRLMERVPKREKLTPREKEVLCLMGEGHDNKEIAQELTISPATARNYVSGIYAKLDVRDRAAAVLYAVKHGFNSKRLCKRA